MGEPKLWRADKCVFLVVSGAGGGVVMLLVVVIYPQWVVADKKRQFIAVQRTGS